MTYLSCHTAMETFKAKARTLPEFWKNKIKYKHQQNKSTAKTTVKQQMPPRLEDTNEKMTEFTYLEAKLTKDGNSESELKARTSKARRAFVALKNIWKTNKMINTTKICLLKSNVLSVLLYAAESWKVTKAIFQMLDVFQSKCLRRILRIYWANKISNKKLHETTGPIYLEVKRRRWRWVGHVCRIPLTSTPRERGKTKGDVEKIS